MHNGPTSDQPPDIFPYRGARRRQLGDDIAPLVVDEVPRGCGWASEAQPKSAVGGAGVGDDPLRQLLAAIVGVRAAHRAADRRGLQPVGVVVGERPRAIPNSHNSRGWHIERFI